MSWATELSLEVFEQPELNAGDTLRKEFSDGEFVTLGTSELENHKLLTYSRTLSSDETDLPLFEAILKLNFDDRLNNSIGSSLSDNSELSITIPFFSGLQSPSFIEDKLTIGHKLLEASIDADTEHSEISEAAHSNWTQV